MKAKQNIENLNSCKLSVNAKGLWSGEVKVYAPTIEDAKKKAIVEANELSKLIEERNKQ